MALGELGRGDPQELGGLGEIGAVVDDVEDDLAAGVRAFGVRCRRRGRRPGASRVQCEHAGVDTHQDGPRRRDDVEHSHGAGCLERCAQRQHVVGRGDLEQDRPIAHREHARSHHGGPTSIP